MLLWKILQIIKIVFSNSFSPQNIYTVCIVGLVDVIQFLHAKTICSPLHCLPSSVNNKFLFYTSKIWIFFIGKGFTEVVLFVLVLSPWEMLILWLRVFWCQTLWMSFEQTFVNSNNSTAILGLIDSAVRIQGEITVIYSCSFS